MFSAPSWNVRNAVSEYPYDHRGAMTVTVQKYQDVSETRTVLAQNSFETMSLWMLQRYVTAEVDPSLSDKIFSDVSNLIESARQNMSDRITDGEELTYNTLVGINKHVDGRGQCFLHSRRILHDSMSVLYYSVKNFCIHSLHRQHRIWVWRQHNK